MKDLELEEVIIFIEYVLNKSADLLDVKLKNHVRYYIDHDEIEMAFEILFLNLIEKNEYPFTDKNMCESIALKLNLKSHSVYDDSFWSKFKTYLLKYSDNSNGTV